MQIDLFQHPGFEILSLVNANKHQNILPYEPWNIECYKHEYKGTNISFW